MAAAAASTSPAIEGEREAGVVCDGAAAVGGERPAGVADDRGVIAEEP